MWQCGVRKQINQNKGGGGSQVETWAFSPAMLKARSRKGQLVPFMLSKKPCSLLQAQCPVCLQQQRYPCTTCLPPCLSKIRLGLMHLSSKQLAEILLCCRTFVLKGKVTLGNVTPCETACLWWSEKSADTTLPGAVGVSQRQTQPSKKYG